MVATWVTYRYAENLAAGEGFVYNPGEHILGTSTPLYTLVLAGLRLLGVPIPAASAAINFLSSLLVVLLTMLIAEQLSGSYIAGLFAALYLLLQGPFIRFTMAGMETPLYILLILGVFWLVVVDQFIYAAFVAGLAAVMRLDGLAVGGALFLGYLLHHRQIPWRALAMYAVPILPWTFFAFRYFGSPIPLSMTAKQAHLQAYGTDRYWIWKHLFTANYGAPSYLLPVGSIALPYLLQKHQFAKKWTIPLIWLGAYLVAYTLVGIEYYEWYLSPVYPVLALMVGSGLYVLWSSLQRTFSAKNVPVLSNVALFLLLALWLFPYAQSLIVSVKSFKEYLVTVERKRVEVGHWLHDQSDPHVTVWAGAIGHIGYTSERYLIDGAGLITPFTRLPEFEPDYYALDGMVPTERRCGVLREFGLSSETTVPPMILSVCGRPPYAQIGELHLMNLRIAHWNKTPLRTWEVSPHALLELQWQVETPQISGDWAVYLHFLDEQNQTLFQADHPLGRQSDGSIRSVTDWSQDERIYTYVPLSEAWQYHQEQIAVIRLGIWNPSSQEYLPIQLIQEGLSFQDGLMIPVVGDELTVK